MSWAIWESLWEKGLLCEVNICFFFFKGAVNFHWKFLCLYCLFSLFSEISPNFSIVLLKWGPPLGWRSKRSKSHRPRLTLREWMSAVPQAPADPERVGVCSATGPGWPWDSGCLQCHRPRLTLREWMSAVPQALADPVGRTSGSLLSAIQITKECPVVDDIQEVFSIIYIFFKNQI